MSEYLQNLKEKKKQQQGLRLNSYIQNSIELIKSAPRHILMKWQTRNMKNHLESYQREKSGLERAKLD